MSAVDAGQVDFRYWHLNPAEPPWFRSATGQGFAAIVWRQQDWWTELRLYPSVVDADRRVEWTTVWEDQDRGHQINAQMACENTGRPSWREAAITRRADGLTEDFMHEGGCYSW